MNNKTSNKGLLVQDNIGTSLWANGILTSRGLDKQQ
jgi:hypothetical protein